jgi:hypothetical protein
MCRITLFSSSFGDDDRRHCRTASRCVRHQPVSATFPDDEDRDLLRDGFTADRSTIESDLPVMWVRVTPATDARVMTVCHAPRRHPAVQPAISSSANRCAQRPASPDFGRDANQFRDQNQL